MHAHTRRPRITDHVSPEAYRWHIGALHFFDLALLRNGAGDATTRVVFGAERAHVCRATLTPNGPGTIEFVAPTRWIADTAAAHPPAAEVRAAHGPGGEWLAARVTHMAAHADSPPTMVANPHPALRQALREVGILHLPRTESPYHELLPAILGQRITAAQALAQWAALCRRFGEPAPGNLDLHLPPSPGRLRSISSWEFHRLGIEQQRAHTLQTAARYAAHIERTRDLTGEEARASLMKLPGIGVWTAAVTVGVSHGDPDALPIGDFHVKNTVAWALTGLPRGTDDEMIATLAPYAGQRWRVVRTLERAGNAAPKFGPRRRLIDVARL